MSRMFRVIASPSVDPNRDRTTPTDSLDAPFVEVGGPNGLVMSFPTPAVGLHSPKPTPAAPPVADRSTIRTGRADRGTIRDTAPAADSPVLSVTFHKFPKPGLRLMQAGVAPEVVAFHFPDHAVSAEYRRVCDDILAQFDTPGPRAVMFAAAESHAGTSTVLVNVAVSLVTHHAHRVLLVDANFARPGIAHRLSCADAPGLADVLGQAIPLAWALQPTPLPNLHVLASGQVTDATEEAVAADLPKLMHQLRQWFDWVVIDAGVWAELPGADGAAAAADGVYLVTRDAAMEREEFVGLRSEITAAGGPVRGYVSTKQ